ncbi:quinone-dependent dihydroorotate dehydrogenase [Paenibacillus sp. JX-17]|uniref:Dihydroorotate dehydrogenase (quinone) n=1 Tax=Paenibacillus lacisoli TaxID=3064525 RepID=A0ABT9CAU5_9BACL|nr:quinone-dependent dihydroorotate dehydrogenase [Paenibacillus sp. JX-17]MDO7905995.1 quinone-dependent dihydroorotate dehydrogenase [Paenibacillus sp. JX-17]
MLYRTVAKPIFFKMDPEKAHHVVIDGLKQAGSVPGGTMALRGMYGVAETPDLAVDLFGLHFKSPIGLAAGLDKNAEAVPGFSAIGFGFMEVGTVTPLPQPGNEQPRLFRLPSDEALINRMGFNNLGAKDMAARLSLQRRREIPVAINIGKNKVTPNEEAYTDYEKCIRMLYPHADFFVVNISSPNTPDLRNLQHGSELKSLLNAVMAEMRAQGAKQGNSKKHVLVKIAPDVSDAELEFMVDVIAASGISGIIATNTTISRENLSHARAGETGGLSGRPLRGRSTEVIRSIYRQTGGKLPIIGSGGVFSARDAYEKITAGASLVEIYTALIYEGPEVNRKLHRGLRQLLRQDGFNHISQAVGKDHK